MLEGSGLVESELVIQVDGKSVGNFNVRTVIDGASGSRDQQLLTLTVPSGVAASRVSVSTNGGAASVRTGVILSDQGALSPGTADPGNTLASALAPGLGRTASSRSDASIGDGANAARDVDLYQLNLKAGDLVHIGLSSAALYSRVRSSMPTAWNSHRARSTSTSLGAGVQRV